MFNLCRLSRSRQEQAAIAGVVPHLQYFVAVNSHLKQFALPILCEMAHAGKKTRAELLKSGGIVFYLDLLTTNNYWRASAIECLATWVAEDGIDIVPVISQPGNMDKIVAVFDSSATPQICESLLKMVTNSIILNDKFANHSSFMTVLLKYVKQAPEALMRVTCLKILAVIYELNKNPKELITKYSLRDVLSARDTKATMDVAVYEQKMIAKLLSAFNAK